MHIYHWQFTYHNLYITNIHYYFISCYHKSANGLKRLHPI